jgi:hypothetical protein
MKILNLALCDAGSEPILAGRLTGKRMFLKALEQVHGLSPETLVLLNFGGAEYVTSSFVAELILPLRDSLRLGTDRGYLALANLSDQAREEVDEFFRRINDAIIACALEGEKVSGVEMLGRLDTKLQETFEFVTQTGETSAAELHARHRESEPIGATAWNNRLTMLATKSLLVEKTSGRAKRYRPLWRTPDGN